MKKHVNIPYFVPHEGCGHSCVFCSQYKITGKQNNKDDKEKEKTRFINEVETAISTISKGTDVEIAFFGGSFTGIEESRMTYLLRWANDFVREGKVSGIRLSTRPDYIDERKLEILKEYGVTSIELGVQSMSERVLEACKRGHTPQDVEIAAKLIKDAGFSLGCQMMLGLPLSEMEDEVATAKSIVEMGADCTRIYPILVFEGTELYRMRQEGTYKPPTLNELIERGAKCLKIFLDGGVKVLRMGLQSADELCGNAEFEPAYGEYVWNRVYLDSMMKALQGNEANANGKCVVFAVPVGDISKAVGQKRRNAHALRERFGLRDIRAVTDSTLTAGHVKIVNYQN